MTATRPRTWRRLVRHLTRNTAVLSALGISVAVVVVLLFGSSGPVGQVALVAIGTLVSLALLPDEPHRLWSVSAQSMAETIPTASLAGAGRELVQALALQQGDRTPGELMSQLWLAQFAELESAAAAPSRVVRNVSYRVTVDRSHTGPSSTSEPTSGSPGPDLMWIQTELSSDRHVPSSPVVFVSFCSNLDALAREFQSDACVLRELVPPLPLEPPGRWVERVQAFVVQLTVGGVDRPLLRHEVSNHGQDAYVVRFVFDSGSIRETYASCTIHTRLQTLDPGVFDVKFSSYHVVGPTRIVFEIRDLDVQLEYSEFMSSTARPVNSHPSISPDGQRVLITTQDDAVLPPGSGVTFRWTAGVPQLLRRPGAGLALVPEAPSLPRPSELPSQQLPVDPTTDAESLVPVDGVNVLDAYAALGILPPRPMRLRVEVLRRLQQADALLPPGFSLVVLDAWRSVDEQRLLMAHYPTSAVEGQYVADPDSSRMRPPHTTGGAVDLTLAWDGEPLALGTDFDSFDVSAHLHSYEQIDGTTRRLRRLLASVLLESGFAPYPFEWWHWSYGDDVWAVHRELSTARYSGVEH